MGHNTEKAMKYFGTPLEWAAAALIVLLVYLKWCYPPGPSAWWLALFICVACRTRSSD